MQIITISNLEQRPSVCFSIRIRRGAGVGSAFDTNWLTIAVVISTASDHRVFPILAARLASLAYPRAPVPSTHLTIRKTIQKISTASTASPGTLIILFNPIRTRISPITTRSKFNYSACVLLAAGWHWRPLAVALLYYLVTTACPENCGTIDWFEEQFKQNWCVNDKCETRTLLPVHGATFPFNHVYNGIDLWSNFGTDSWRTYRSDRRLKTFQSFNNPFHLLWSRSSPDVCGIRMTSVKFQLQSAMETPFGGACIDFFQMPSCGFLCGNLEFSCNQFHFLKNATRVRS